MDGEAREHAEGSPPEPPDCAPKPARAAACNEGSSSPRPSARCAGSREPPAAPELEEAVSGQSWGGKCRFASALISPMAIGTVLALARDFYILNFGANVPLMSVLGSLLAFWGPLCFPLAGYAMEQDLLARWFPWASWGRRAPWFLLHSACLAVASALIFLPPSLDTDFVPFWLAFLGAWNCWNLAIIFLSFESGRVELFPTKEERSDVELCAKLNAGLGIGLGMIANLTIAANIKLSTRLVVGGYLLVVSLASLLSLPFIRRAREAYEEGHVNGMFLVFKTLFKTPALLHLMAYRFVEGFIRAGATTSCLYWLTLVDGLVGDQRSVWLGGIVLLLGIVALVSLPPWFWFFHVRRRGLNINLVCAVVVGAGVLAPVLLWVVGDSLPRPAAFMIYVSVMTGTITGQTFWRAVALGWVIDEDCHACPGRRREAVFAGVVSLASSLGRASAALLVLNGLAAAGMQLANCEVQCAGHADPDGCIHECHLHDVARQPQAVRTFLRVMYLGVVPAAQLLSALLCATFPIYGDRLDRIYTEQNRKSYEKRNSEVEAAQREQLEQLEDENQVKFGTEEEQLATGEKEEVQGR